LFAGKKKNVYVFKFNSEIDEFELNYNFLGFESDKLYNDGILHIAFSDDDKNIFSTSIEGYTHIFDSENYTEINKIKLIPDSSSNTPTTAAISKDKNILVVGDRYAGLNIFNINSGEKLYLVQFEGIKFNKINSVALSDDNDYMAYCANDGSLGLYKIDENTSVYEVENNISVWIYPNPAGDYIEISSINPTLKGGVDEGSDIQIFDMLGVAVSPAGG
jgi:WD40 repeat protein